MTDTQGDKCGIDPIQIGGWPVKACNWHDSAYSEGSWAERNITRAEVDKQFLIQLLELSKQGQYRFLKRIASYGLYGIARLFGAKWWEGQK